MFETVEAADARDVGLGRGVVDRRAGDRDGRVLAVRGAVVAGRRDDSLALGRHLLKDRLLGLCCAIGLGFADAPGRRDDRGAVSSLAIWE